MTVAPVVTETAYVLAGSNLGPFATVWPYAVPGDVTAYLVVGDEVTVLNEGADFTVVAGGGGSLAAGGNVTLNGGLVPGGGWAANSKIALLRLSPTGQPSALGEALGFSPAAYEAALDYLSRQIQDIATRLTRALEKNPGASDFNAGSFRIVDLGDGVDDHDAVNYGQLQAVIASVQALVTAAQAAEAAAAASAAAAAGDTAAAIAAANAAAASAAAAAASAALAAQYVGAGATQAWVAANFDALGAAAAAQAYALAHSDALGAAAAAQAYALAHSDALGSAAAAQAAAQAYADGLIAALNDPQQSYNEQNSGMGGGTVNVSVSFTPPGPGVIVILGSRVNSATDTGPGSGEIQLNTVSQTSDNSTEGMAHFWSGTTAGGAAVTATYSTTATVQFTARVQLLFLPNL